MKACNICCEERPLSEFYLNKTRPDGLQISCKVCQRQSQQARRRAALDRGELTTGNKIAIRLRLEVLRQYGGDEPCCACCGIDHYEFLSLHHANGGGSQHRREISGGKAGLAFYRALKKQGFPAGFEILCNNCHMSITAYGYCPHRQSCLRPFLREERRRMDGEKQCTRCHEWKLEGEFRKSSKGKGGYHARCKVCNREEDRVKWPDRYRRSRIEVDGALKKAKLNEKEVREIRSRRLGGERPSALARAYGVSASLITLICAGKIWRRLLPLEGAAAATDNSDCWEK